jgi:hypothetical protein
MSSLNGIRTADEVTKFNWWKYGEKRPAMRKALGSLSQYFAVPEVSKWAVFVPCSCDGCPEIKLSRCL